MMRVAGILLISLLISVTTPLVALPLLRRAQILDVPNHRSLHSLPAVRGIGVVSLLAVLFAGGASLLLRIEQALPVAIALGGGVVAALLGLVEDVVGLPVRVRLLAQGVIACSIGVVAIVLTGTTWWWLPVAVFLILGYINVANFMDGVNGISCLHGLVAGAYFTVLGVLLDQPWLTVTAMALFASHLGLLPWNAHGRAFLGDVGSYLLGSLVAICTVGLLLRGEPLLLASAPMLVYLTDTVSTLLLRVKRHQKITESHRTHAYQRFVLCGRTHLQSALLVTAFSTICSVLAIAAFRGWLTNGVAFPLVSLVLITYLLLPYQLERSATRSDS